MFGFKGFIVREAFSDDSGEVASGKFWNRRAGTDVGRSNPPGMGVPDPVTGAGVDEKAGPRVVRGVGKVEADIYVRQDLILRGFRSHHSFRPAA